MTSDLSFYALKASIPRRVILELLDTIDQSRRARLNGRAELFRELRRKTVCALRVDKEADV